MAKQSINTLKNWFKKGLKPLEVQFAAWLDSYFHKDDMIPIESVQGLADVLNGLPSAASIEALKQLGVITKSSTADLSTVPGSGAKIVLVINSGFFIYASSGTPDGITIFPSSDGGVWILSLTAGTGGGTLSDTLTAGNDAEGKRIVGLANPVNPQDADTKAARDTAIAAAIAALADSAPAVLDTLNELAAALGDDPNFAATMTGLLAAKAPLASPALTGTPTVPTAALATNTTQAASTAFVKNAIDDLNLKQRLKSIAHTSVVDLDDNRRSQHTIVGAIAYTKGAAAHIIGNVRQDSLIANGANKPTFSSDFVVVWDNWVNTNGVLNVVRFEYLSNGKIQVDLRNAS